MCDESMKDICPTAVSAVLLRLFHAETGKPCEFDTIDLVSWWVKKIDDPDEADEWITSAEMWRSYARHIHALVAVNVPCIADAVGYDLGIETVLIPKPDVSINPDGTVSELWTLKTYGRSIPPFGFETWQRPLKLTRFHPCGLDDFDLDLDVDASDEEQIKTNQSLQSQQLARV